MTRLRWLVLGVLFALVATACEIDATVEIEVDDDGSGIVKVTVAADADAVARVPDAPDGLRFDDLLAAGWSVEGPNVDSSGSLTVVATKGFPNVESLPGVLDEIVGEDVVFRNVALVKDHDFEWIGLAPASTRYDLTGTVHPDFDITAFGDQFLPGNIPELGQEPAVIESDFVGTFEQALGLTVVVQLPGEVEPRDDDGPSTRLVDDGTATWTVQFGGGAVTLDTSSSEDDILPRVWAVVALLAFALFVLIVLTHLGTYGLAVLRTPKGRRRRDIRKRQHRAASREEEANRPRRRLLRLLVVDVHGVLVRPTDPVEGLLLPLIMAERPDVDPQQVRELHRRLVLGRISVEEFWSEVGLGPVADEIETRYLSSFRLVPGLHPFLDRMAASRLPVAAVGNQPRAWGDRLRRMAALDDTVASWMVSGDVGSRLPEPALFEATRRTMSVDLYDCFYLSNIPEHLDAAKELGMATGLFVTGNEPAPPTDHTLVRGFEDLLRARGG